jgi:hypothetical protein
MMMTSAADGVDPAIGYKEAPSSTVKRSTSEPLGRINHNPVASFREVWHRVFTTRTVHQHETTNVFLCPVFSNKEFEKRRQKRQNSEVRWGSTTELGPNLHEPPSGKRARGNHKHWLSL